MAKREQAKPEKTLLWCTIAFSIVYVVIHILLNITNNGNSDIEWPSDHEKLIVELSGPITISICSSLLILSYGTFLLHGLKHLSVSAPSAFLTAFILFVIGQIIVQITGHLEIYVNNYTLHHDNRSPPSWVTIPAYASYTIAFAWLFILESYALRVFDSLRDQLPLSLVRHASDARIMLSLTLASILLLLVKILLSAGQQSKFGIVALALVVEMAMALVVVYFSVRRGNAHSK